METGPAPRELMRQLTEGRLSRRAFIVRAATLGFSASAIAGFLAACGGEAPATSAPATTAATTPTPTRAATAAAPGAATRTGTVPGPAATRTTAPGATRTASPSTSGGGAASAIGAATTRPLAAAGGLGPAPTRRGGGGTLKLLWWQGPTILNPHQAQGTKDYDAARIAYEPLASFGPDDALVPFLAAEIPSRQNGGVAADGKSVTWKLKQGVKWSDGAPFTARDVVFTHRYVTDKETAAVSSGNYEDVEKVEAPDDNTVRITFKEPTLGWYVPFCGPNGYILPEHIFKDGMGAAAKNFPANLKPVGTGPYRVANFAPGDLVTYELNPNWREANGPFYDRIELKGGGEAESAARAVLQTGDYNVAWNLQIPPANLNQLQRGGRGRLELTPNWGIERILVNFSDPTKEVNEQRSEKNTPHPFQADKRVRQAYALLCDRKVIAEQLYGPAGQPTANILTNPKSYNSPNYGNFEFSIQKAEQLLDQAGWTKSGQYRAKGGVQMAVVFQTSTNAVRQSHQQIVKDAFEKAGIKTEIKVVPGTVYFSSEAGNPDTSSKFYADLEMFTNNNSFPDPWDYFNNWTTAEIAQKENSWNGNNYHRWSNKEYDDLVRAAKSNLDEASRARQFIRMNDILTQEEIVVIPQVDRLGPQAVSNDIKGVEPTAWDVTVWNIANWTKG